MLVLVFNKAPNAPIRIHKLIDHVHKIRITPPTTGFIKLYTGLAIDCVVMIGRTNIWGSNTTFRRLQTAVGSRLRGAITPVASD